ncbi:diguanylate cyclase (GGDEF)-like protein/PAS domain S-box-containing protein [Kibdelosporangium banguiense]|uniref:Diguanylate cyclase (GGDEF)-like protein/PAS domain S-box-containing protein n=1 Tax=Kibdelosporangium banguiense TaxID=1365924 RepID=A0ABS4TGJ5_9PSEU|nr:EAL domain-containing protein [Kibdelosporangium banguiense]MBP2323551.1 diguanylate cyclase (GGDEF)-like protein/PAS domain S-box-containing protein [Kibdelosporangium banguiense]
MTSPLHDSSRVPAGPARTPADHARARVKVARKWAYLISSSTYLPLSQQEIDQAMHEMVDVVFNAALRDPFNPEEIIGVGARLVDMRCTGPTSLRRTIDVLGKALLTEPELYRIDGKQDERAVQLLGVLASDYLESTRQFVFTQQEDIKEALVRAGSDAQRQMRATEARFDAVFTSSPTGIAIVDLAGGFVRTNTSLDDMLDRQDYAGLTLFDVVDPDEVPFLKAACKDLADGWAERLHQQRRLLRSDGEAVRASLSVTVLRDNGSTPTHFLVTVQDVTEMSLLQGQLSHQSLHDVLTGLPNRQYFSTRLESVLRQANPETGATLYHLDLDAFSMITDGLGRQVGDRVLMNAAQRLKAVLAGENAMVARFDGDEFAIIVENSDTTPDVVSMVASINEELAEPIYFEGRGVAASVSIGIVHRPPADSDITELLRTADMTLRRAKANGRRQWGLFDASADALDRSRFSLSAQMPGALEMGEITVVCRPLVRLADSSVAGFEGLLHWEHDGEVISHADCLELAEQTGLILPLRDTLLEDACKQIHSWNTASGADLPIVIDLTANQACDPDLVGVVLLYLEQIGLRPGLLQIGVPVSVLLADRGESVDNFRMLAENGIGTAVHGFGSAAGDIECIEDLPTGSARIAPRLVERQRSSKSTLIARTLTDLVEVAKLAGASVTVDGIETAEQADWWREIGADTALGRYFAPEPADLRELAPSSWNIPGTGSTRR